MDKMGYDTSAYMQVPIGEKSVVTEISGDFTLPDYQPEIKRLLCVSASILPYSKHVGDSEAELVGGIDYYALYTGSDNQVYCAPLSSEYKVSVPMEKNELSLVNILADAEIIPDSVVGRVTSPRKLNVKCRLKSFARMYGDMPIDKSLLSLAGENQVLLGRSETTRRIFAQSELARLNDEMILGSADGEVRVINASCHALVNECVVAKGAVSTKGEVYLKLLMCKEPDGKPYCVTRRIPFSEVASVEGAESGCEASAKGSVCEMEISVEDSRIGIDLGLMLDVSVCKNECVTYVKDVYSTSRATDCVYRSIPYLDHGRAFNSNFTQSDSMTLESVGLSPDHKVIDVNGYAHPESPVLEGDRWLFTGKTRFTVLAERDGEYTSIDIEMPYRYMLDAKHFDADKMYAYATPEVISARARLDGERIGIDAELMMRCLISSKRSAQMLDSVSFGDETEKRRGEYVICYPTAQDSLWSVAKKYSTTVSKLASTNKLTPPDTPDGIETLNGVRYLVI